MTDALPAPVMLHDTARAPNPRRVSIFLAEKGVDLPRTQINIMTDDHRAEAYLARVGAPVVPALELEDGSVITETVAICRYLEALYPKPNLCGAGPLETALVEMWQRRVEFALFQSIAAHVRHSNPRMAVLERDQCPEWGAANRPRIDAAMAMLDARLRGRAFIALDRVTVADITALAALDFLKVARISIPETLEALTGWLARMRARPSARAGLENS